MGLTSSSSPFFLQEWFWPSFKPFLSVPWRHSPPSKGQPLNSLSRKLPRLESSSGALPFFPSGFPGIYWRQREWPAVDCVPTGLCLAAPQAQVKVPLQVPESLCAPVPPFSPDHRGCLSTGTLRFCVPRGDLRVSCKHIVIIIVWESGRCILQR